MVMSVAEQVSPSRNAFRPVKDVESIHRDFILVEVDAPAPSSSTRTSLLKLTEKDFTSVQQKFRDFER